MLSASDVGTLGTGEAERQFQRETERHSGIKPEHFRSVAMLASRFVQEVFGFVKEKPIRSEGRALLARKGAWGKDGGLNPPQHTEDPDREQRSGKAFFPKTSNNCALARNY